MSTLTPCSVDVAGSATSRPMLPRITTVDLTVTSVTQSIEFFCDVLGFELPGLPQTRPGLRTAQLHLGGEVISVTEQTDAVGRLIPADNQANEFSFQHLAIVVSDLEAAFERLRRRRVGLVSPRPQYLPAWNVVAAGIGAAYFRGPDGHFLELIQYPAGKGAARWQSRERLFLGIDHTALGVSSTHQSVRFYGSGLGWRVTGRSENHGPEQAALSGIPKANVRITTLRGPAGMGIELLEYRGESRSRRLRDVIDSGRLPAWRLVVEAEDPSAALQRAVAAGGHRVSASTDHGAEFVVDPDGHLLKFIRGLGQEE